LDKWEDKWEFYKDKRGFWQWMRKISDGTTIASSTRGYENKDDCIENARSRGYTDNN